MAVKLSVLLVSVLFLTLMGCSPGYDQAAALKGYDAKRCLTDSEKSSHLSGSEYKRRCRGSSIEITGFIISPGDRKLKVGIQQSPSNKEPGAVFEVRLRERQEVRQGEKVAIQGILGSRNYRGHGTVRHAALEPAELTEKEIEHYAMLQRMKERELNDRLLFRAGRYCATLAGQMFRGSTCPAPKHIGSMPGYVEDRVMHVESICYFGGSTIRYECSLREGSTVPQITKHQIY